MSKLKIEDLKKIKEKLFTKRTSKVKEDITGQVNIKVMEKA